MNSLEDLLNIDTSNFKSDNPPLMSSGSIDTSDDVTSDIPEYMFVDTEVIGYPDTETQFEIYKLALHGTLPLSGTDVRILDIGAGRGDFYRYIQSMYHSLGFDYVGYEVNPLLVDIGNQLSDSESIKHADFLESDLSPDTYTHVYSIGTLNIDYGTGTGWVTAERMIEKAIEIATHSVTFVLLHDNGGIDEYHPFPIPNMTDYILRFGYPFKLTYGKIEGVYEFTIFKQTY